MSAGPPDQCDLAVVGAGILGLAVARELAGRRPGLDVCVLEREEEIARHQTGHNSGVVHAGVYYEPGSLKARLCVEGARMLYELCERSGVAYERCGKVIVALDDSELPRLDELERRGAANRVPGLKRLDAAAIRELEPHCAGVAGLHSPNTGIADFKQVARALGRELSEAGGSIVTGTKVTGVDPDSRGIRLRHVAGETSARFAVFCAGRWSDRLASSAGASPDPRIVPFRGAYLRLKPQRRSLVRSLIYPVPDPSLPFLGVHLTRSTGGEVLLGPTAFLSKSRLGSTLAWPGSWRMFTRWWRTGVSELRYAVSRASFVREAARYVPELRPEDAEPAFFGVRAQALGRDGRLIDDFVFSETERALHVRNAPSPAATSSLAIAKMVADRVEPELA